MEENRNKTKNTDQQRNTQGIIDRTTDESGLHLQNPPKGADQMNESFSKPAAADPEQQGDASRYANTSGNEPDTSRT